MLNIIRDETNHVIAGFINEGSNEFSYCADCIYQVAMEYDLRNFSLFKLEKFSSELYKLGFISFVEFAILNFQFRQNTHSDFVIVRIFNDNIDGEFNISIIKIWEEYLEECYTDPDSTPFVSIIKALLKKMKYLEDIKFKHNKISIGYEA